MSQSITTEELFRNAMKGYKPSIRASVRIDFDEKDNPFVSFPVQKTKYPNGDYFFAHHPDVKASKFMKALINTSRVHWRKELIDMLAPMNSKERKKYKSENKFTLSGPLLTPEERQEQVNNFLSKMLAIGYLLSPMTEESPEWVVYGLDQFGGRSGKSFMFKFLRYFRKSIYYATTWPIPTDKILSNLKPDTEFACFHDILPDIKILRIVKALENKPVKLAIAGNTVNLDLSRSYYRRHSLITVFSDYYHCISDKDKKMWQISDDFGKQLQSIDYSQEEWNSDFDFINYCVFFYHYCRKYDIKKIEPTLTDEFLKKGVRP